MPVFRYSARDDQGRTVSETLSYPDMLSLRRHLRKSNLYVLDVVEVASGGVRKGFNRGIGLYDLVTMTRQLRTMLNAGMPLVTGIEALSEQAANPRLAEVLAEVSKAVAHGNSMSSALGEYPQHFPEMLITLIKAGEDGGRLTETLTEAGRQLELQAEVRQKVISAMMYPAFTLIATVATIAAMLIWIVPVFEKIFKDLKAPLPALTQGLIDLSGILTHQGWIVVVVAVSFVIAFQRYNKTPDGRMRIDALKLKLPMFGSVYLKSASANLTGSLAGLLNSGVPLLSALQTSAQVCGNEVLAEAVRRAAKNVALGRRLSSELELCGRFPLMVVRMIAIAEDVGTLPDVLKEIATSYIDEVEHCIRRVVSLIEPIMVICVGGVVGSVLVALYYPIFTLPTAFAKGG